MFKHAKKNNIQELLFLWVMWPMGILFPVDVLNTCTCSKKDLHFVLSLNNGLLIHIHCSSILISNFMKDDSNNNNFLNLYYFPNLYLFPLLICIPHVALQSSFYTPAAKSSPIPKFILLLILLAIHWTSISFMNTRRIYFFFIAAFRVLKR